MALRASSVPAIAGAIVVLASLAEALGVVAQARGGPRNEHWHEVKAMLERELAPEDGLVVGTRWLEPLARAALGDALLTRSRLGTSPATWPRVALIAEAGAAHLPGGFVEERRVRAGALEVCFARASQPFRVLGRVEELLEGASAALASGSEEVPCAWGSFGLFSGNLGSGPAWPTARFACPGSGVARSFVTDTDYRAHDAIFVDVPGDGRSVVVRFAERELGSELRGGVGLYVEAERDGKGAPVTLEWRVGARVIGSLVHRDGEGWVAFTFPTGLVRGERAVAELRLASPGGQRRLVGVSAAFVEPSP